MKFIITLLALSLPSYSMDTREKIEIMRNGHRIAQQHNLNSSQEKLNFMRNGGKLPESNQKNVPTFPIPEIKSTSITKATTLEGNNLITTTNTSDEQKHHKPFTIDMTQDPGRIMAAYAYQAVINGYRSRKN